MWEWQVGRNGRKMQGLGSVGRLFLARWVAVRWGLREIAELVCVYIGP